MKQAVMKTERLLLVPETTQNRTLPIAFRLILRNENVSAGVLLLLAGPDRHGGVRIAFATEESYRRKGYMSEAISVLFRLIRPYARNAQYAQATIPEENRAAEAFLEKNGFRRERSGAYECWILEKPKPVYHILFACFGMAAGGFFALLFQKSYLSGMLSGFVCGILLGAVLNRNEMLRRIRQTGRKDP